MNRTLLAFLGAALLGASTGCLPKTDGELSNGGFTYFCASDKDLACRDDIFGASGIPDAIAVGAHFDLRFDPDGADGPTTVAPASREILTTELSLGEDTTGLRFTAPGTVAVLARRGTEIVDFVHVTGALLDRVTLTDQLGDQITSIATTTSSFHDKVVATPRDDLGNVLAGALDYTWESSDEDVLSVSTSFDVNEATLVPKKAGKAVLTVTVLDRKASVEVTVGGL